LWRVDLTNKQAAKFIEIKKDTRTSARAGLLKINGYHIKTPVLWLGHNFKAPICLWNEEEVNLPGLLVNACEILRRPGRVKNIYDRGIRSYLGYQGPIMMDSGGFLFQKNKRINVRHSKISEMYKKADIDIGVVLDHPLDPTLPASHNRQRWERTLRNTAAMASHNDTYEFMPVVHGYTLNALKKACQQIRKILGEPSLIGIGSLVPLMKTNLSNKFSYQKSDGANGNHEEFLLDALKLVRDHFPSSFLHVFGVGGITTALAVFSFGADSTDSVAWRLKAAYGAIQLPGTSDLFLSPRLKSPKSRPVLKEKDEISLLRCNCPECSPYKNIGWLKRHLDSSFKARTIHNGWVFLKEVQAFRKAILAKRGHVFIRKRLSKRHHFFRLFNDRK